MATVLAVTNKNGGAFKVGNDWLRFSFKLKGASMPQQGDEVEYTLDARGYVDTIHALPKGGPSAPVITQPGSLPSTQLQAAGWSPQTSVKQAALSCASRMMLGVGGTPEQIIAQTFEYARAFEFYLTGHSNLPPPARFLSNGAQALQEDTAQLFPVPSSRALF